MKGQKRGGLFLILSLLVCFGLAYRVVDASKLKMDREKQVKQNEVSIRNLSQSIESLTKEIKESDSMDYVEEVARKDLGMVKPREIIFVDENRENPDSSVEKGYEGGN